MPSAPNEPPEHRHSASSGTVGAVLGRHPIAVGLLALAGLVVPVVVLAVLVLSVPMCACAPPDGSAAEFATHANDSGVRIVHAGGEPVATDRVAVTVDGEPRGTLANYTDERILETGEAVFLPDVDPPATVRLVSEVGDSNESTRVVTLHLEGGRNGTTAHASAETDHAVQIPDTAGPPYAPARRAIRGGGRTVKWEDANS